MSKDLSVYYSPLALQHSTGAGVFEAMPSPLFEEDEPHPENAQRISNMRSVLRKGPIARQIDWLEAPSATLDQMLRFHDASYLESLIGIPKDETRRVTSSTVFGPGSWLAVEAAAGQAIAAIDHVWRGKGGLAYALVRPPGHHAQPSMADGYCFVNNIGVAIEEARSHGLRRAAVIDWDVHHGNGTQHVFEDDPSVLFFSTHQYPYYPGTGSDKERGRGEGEGATINVPMSGGQGTDDFREIFQKVLLPAADAFKPEFVLISAGFDAHEDDPLASMSITDEGYGELTRLVVGIANTHCHGRIVACLEGGYDLRALSASVDQHLMALMDA